MPTMGTVGNQEPKEGQAGKDEADRARPTPTPGKRDREHSPGFTIVSDHTAGSAPPKGKINSGPGRDKA